MKKKYSLINIKKDFKHNKSLYLMVLPMLAYVIIFSYIPMGWLAIAFENFKPARGLFRSEWVGIENFVDFFSSIYFKRVIFNTISINLKDLLISFPLTIVLALLINEVGNKYFKNMVQIISYAPFFVSTVIICGLVANFCGEGGLITNFFNQLTGHEGSLISDVNLFQGVYVGSGIWQGLGFGSIVFVAALAGVDQELYEAAKIDGANRLKQAWHITIPGISSMIIIMLILRIGSLLSGSADKIILLYNSLTMDKADIIASYVYRKGLIDSDYGYSTAVGLFNSVINLTLIIVANKISKKYSESSLF